MKTRVMVAGDWTMFRHMVGHVISGYGKQRLVVLDAMPNYPMAFELHELIWI